MPLVLLIRHGENDYTKKGVLAGRMPGVHLNERGRQQAQELAQALVNAPIRAIYTSPLERAVETAEPIAAIKHLKLIREPGLVEADVGDWQGRSVRRLALTRSWRTIQNAPSRAAHPGGETIFQVQTRVVAALEAICLRHKPRDVIACVFHADPIKLTIAHFIGLPLDYFQRLSCDTASLTMLAIGPSSARLMWLNRRSSVPLDFPKPKR